jgi:hypothetical protein
MIDLIIKLIKAPPSADKLISNIRFGTAVGLTRTAKAAQAASVSAIQSAFTVRSNWYQQSNKFGIRITPATKQKLQSSVHTLAYWLEPHERGGKKTSRRPSGMLAVPQINVRRTKRQIIPKAQRPRNLKGSFVIPTRSGPMIFIRAKRRSKAGVREGYDPNLRAYYALEPSVHLKRQSTFFDPIQKTVEQQLKQNIIREVENALRSMK